MMIVLIGRLFGDGFISTTVAAVHILKLVHVGVSQVHSGSVVCSVIVTVADEIKLIAPLVYIYTCICI